MGMVSETYVLCEGYHDRAFLKASLLHLGCSGPSNQGRDYVRDPWDLFVEKGQFVFYSNSNQFIRVIPVGGGT